MYISICATSDSMTVLVGLYDLFWHPNGRMFAIF